MAKTPVPAFDPQAADALATLAELVTHRDRDHWAALQNALIAAVAHPPLTMRALRLAADAGLADSAKWGLQKLPAAAAFEIASVLFTSADRDTEAGRALVEAATFALWETGPVARWLPLLLSIVRGDAPIHTKRHALYFAGHVMASEGHRDQQMIDAAVDTLGQADADAAEAWIAFFNDVGDPRAVPFLVDALARDSDGSRALEVLRKQPAEIVAPVLRAWLPDHAIENSCDRGMVADYMAELDVTVPAAGQTAGKPSSKLLAGLCVAGNVAGVRNALDLDAPVGTIDDCPETVLHRLVFAWLDYSGNGVDSSAVVEIAKLLVAHGADPKAKLKWKWTPAEEMDYPVSTTPIKMMENAIARVGDDKVLARNDRSVAVADVKAVLAILNGAAPTRRPARSTRSSAKRRS
jgi:hypothetical protein